MLKARRRLGKSKPAAWQQVALSERPQHQHEAEEGGKGRGQRSPGDAQVARPCTKQEVPTSKPWKRPNVQGIGRSLQSPQWPPPDEVTRQLLFLFLYERCAHWNGPLLFGVAFRGVTESFVARSAERHTLCANVAQVIAPRLGD